MVILTEQGPSIRKATLTEELTTENPPLVVGYDQAAQHFQSYIVQPGTNPYFHNVQYTPAPDAAQNEEMEIPMEIGDGDYVSEPFFEEIVTTSRPSSNPEIPVAVPENQEQNVAPDISLPNNVDQEQPSEATGSN